MNSPEGDGCVMRAGADVSRKIWRGFGTTVSLLATEWEGRRYAMLATAVTSLSMDPPSLVVCINRSSSAYDAFVQRRAFSLGVLSADLEELGLHLAQATGQERFAKGSWKDMEAPGEVVDGLPWLKDAQATLFCEIDNSVDFGTHTIFMARIQSCTEPASSNPLIYCEGGYGVFSPLAAAG